jgi:hypothetical protein
MKSLENKRVNDKTILFLKSLIVIWPFLFIWQGLDMTDTGYLLTGGQQIFIEPQNIQFSYLLSFLINGSWNRLAGSLGLMGAYLGGAVLYLLTAVCVYVALKKAVPEKILLLGILISIMIPNLMRYITYNNLTSLFFVAGSGIMIAAFRKKSIPCYFLSGILFGLTVYLRLPNIVSIFLFVAIIIGHFLDDGSWKDNIKESLSFLAGFALALVIPFVILHLAGLSGQYVETFHRLWDIMTDPSSHHSGGGLIKKVIMDLDRTFAAFFKGFLILAILAKINDTAPNRFMSVSITTIVAVTVVITAFGFLGRTAGYHYYVIAFSGFILLLQIFGFTPSNRVVRFASLLALLVMGFAMAGSNTGFSAARYDLWLAFPLSLYGLSRMEGLNICGSEIAEKVNRDINPCLRIFSTKGIGMVRNVICVSLILFFSILCYRFSYRDSDRRYQLRYSVDHPAMKYFYTTEQRARTISEALAELSKYCMPGDYLLAYNYIPLIHYLTGTRPYAYHSWPDMYTPELLLEKLKQAIVERKIFPPVIRAKYPPLNDSWPQEHLSGRGSSRHHEVFDEFLKHGKYVQVWENDFFQILLPPASW